MPTYTDTFDNRPQYELRLIVTEGSQNIGNNTTSISWTLQVVETTEWGSWSNNAATYSVTIDGQNWSGSFTYDFRGSTNSKTIASGSRTVTHNSDGTKTLSTASSVGGGTTIGSASTSNSFALDTIPRASTPTLSASSFDAGDSVTINTNRLSTSFTHTVQYAFGSIGYTNIATGVATSVAWVPPLSLLNQIPNATSGTGTIRLLTYSGGTYVGSKTVGFTLKAPTEIKPDFSTVTNSEFVSSVNTIVGAYVQNLTRLSLAITGAAGTYGSTISSYKITVAGQTINAASGTTAVIGSSGTVAIVGTVTDSRGRSTSKTVNVNVLAYSNPSVNSSTLQFRRSLSNGTLDEEGTFVRIDMNASVASLINSTQRNELTYRTYFRVRGTTSWGVLKNDVNTGGIAFNSSFVVASGDVDPFDTQQSYEVRLDIVDKFKTVTIVETIATSTVFMHWNGNSLAVGKFWEQGSLDVAGQIYQNDGRRVLDTNDVTFSAVYNGTTEPIDLPPGISVVQWSVDATWPANYAICTTVKLSENRLSQTVVDKINGNTWIRSSINPGWGAWRLQSWIGDGHTHSLNDINILLLGASQNLNSYTSPGLYYQNSNAQASGGTNYPAPYAGLLEVHKGPGIDFTEQRYTCYADFHRVFTRGRYNGAWSAWKEHTLGAQAVAAGNYTTTATLNAGSGTTISRTFPSGRFTAAPQVTMTPSNSSRLNLAAINVTTSGFTGVIDNFTSSAAAQRSFYWVAVQE